MCTLESPSPALKVIVRNTFLDIEDSDDEAVGTRSSSVPRAWKPLSPISKKRGAGRGRSAAGGGASAGAGAGAGAGGSKVGGAGAGSDATPSSMASTSLSDGDRSEIGSSAASPMTAAASATPTAPAFGLPVNEEECMMYGQEWFSPYGGFHLVSSPVFNTPMCDMSLPPMIPLPHLHSLAWTGPMLGPDGNELHPNMDCGPMSPMPPHSPLGGCAAGFMPGPDGMAYISSFPIPSLPTSTAEPPTPLSASRLNPEARSFEPGATAFSLPDLVEAEAAAAADGVTPALSRPSVGGDDFGEFGAEQ